MSKIVLYEHHSSISISHTCIQKDKTEGFYAVTYRKKAECKRLLKAHHFSTSGGGHWLDRMEWHAAGWSVCLPLLIFRCTIKSRSSLLAPAHPGGPETGP